MKATIEYITPEKAQRMLKDNEHNRTLSEAATEKYAQAMIRGRWIENGAPICFSGDTLLDGQHRLSALIKSGISRHFVVVSGLEKSAFTSFDTGKSRSLSDVLSIQKQENEKTLAMTIRQHFTFTATGGFDMSKAQKQFTHAEYLDYNELHPQIKKSVLFVCSFPRRQKALMAPGPTSCLHALFSDRDSFLADEFIRKFHTGENITEEDPIYRLREKFIEAQTCNNAKFRLTPDEKSVSMILAWNATRDGVPLNRIITRARGTRGVRKVSIT